MQGKSIWNHALFLGNLPWKINIEKLNNAFYGCVTHAKWITDKESGMFYGTCFVEVDTSENAAACVAMDGEKLMGRPVKIQYSPARPDAEWPPADGLVDNPNFAGGGVKAKKTSKIGKVGPPETPQPEGCCKLFMGNLSYSIDDDTIVKFFKDCGGEVRDIRWLTHKDSGEFKGCGYVQFYDPDTCHAAAQLNGTVVMGRPVRLDWAE